MTLASLGLGLALGACTSFFEIPIETPIQPKLDVSAFRRVLIVGFITASDKSVRSFGGAIELAPELADTHRMLGRVALARGELGPACVFYERSAQLSGDDYASLQTAGLVRRSLGDAQRARRNFGEALGRITTRLGTSPDELQALGGRVRCLLHWKHR